MRIANRLERRFDEDRASPVSLTWFSGGRLVREAAGHGHSSCLVPTFRDAMSSRD